MNQSFAFYRILGNDLPPRHGERQTIDSLRFILDHESEFPNCEKRWVVNRIADAEREAEIIALLDERKQVWRRISFDAAEYAGCFLDADGLPATFNTLSIAAGNTKQRDDMLAFEWLYRQKNLCAIGINSARNFALADGVASGATWIMPWDGQCFLTPDDFQAMRTAADASTETRYLLVPFYRITDNQILLQPEFEVGKEQEPHIVFHRDAHARFDELLRYGRGNKSELLDRIGSPRKWHWRTEWEPVRQSAALDSGRIAIAGRVIRLGAADLQGSGGKVTMTRWTSRFAGLASHCATLDARQVHAARATSRLACYAPMLALAAKGATLGAIGGAASDIAAAPSPTDLPSAIAAVAAFAVAAEFTANKKYADRAVSLIRDWFVTPARTADAAKIPTVVDLRDVWALADALRMLDRSRSLLPADRTAVQAWFRAMRDRLARGDNAVAVGNHVGVFHDLLLGSVGTYTDDELLLTMVLTRASLRIHRQIEPGGWQPGEGAGVAPLHRALIALQGLIALAWLGRNCGIDLWRYAGANHRSIPMAARFIAQNRAMFSDYAIGRARFDDRIEMALRTIPNDAADVDAIADVPRRAVTNPGQLGAADGFAPLWPILLATEEENTRPGHALERPVA